MRTVNATELFYNKLLEKLRHRQEQQWHARRRHKHMRIPNQIEEDFLFKEIFEDQGNSEKMKSESLNDGDHLDNEFNRNETNFLTESNENLDI